MTTTPEAPASTDPIAAILKADGALVRLGGLVLAICAMFLLCVVRVGTNVTTSDTLIQLAPMAIAFPILLAVSIVLTATPKAGRYAGLSDIAALVMGLFASGTVITTWMQAQKDAAEYNSMLTGLRQGEQGTFSADLSLGAFAVFLGTAAAAWLAVAAVTRKRRS